MRPSGAARVSLPSRSLHSLRQGTGPRLRRPAPLPTLRAMDHPPTSPPDGPLAVRRDGLTSYEAAHARQLELLAARVAGRVPDTLILCEHPAVITLGRGTGPGAVLAAGEIPVVEVERGGEATLHLPGQLVGYPIRRLPPGARDLHAHLRKVEDLLIETLDRFGLPAGRVAGKTGVWIAGARKIASIGVACRRWVTYHGFALNVDCDLGLFASIRPCGFEAQVMTSLERERPGAASLEEVAAEVERLAPRHLPPLD